MNISYNFYLNNDPKSPNKEKAIFLYIRNKGDTFIIHTGERIKPEYWDIKKQEARKSYIGHPEFNDYLDGLKEKVKRIVRSALIDNQDSTFDDIKRELSREYRKDSVKNDFFEVFNFFIDSRKQIVSKATTTKFKTILKQIKDYADKHNVKITFDSLDLSFFDGLHNHFLSIGISNNTIHKNMQFVKSFLRWSLEREYTKNNRFDSYKNIKQVETDNIALSKTDLSKIIKCNKLDSKLDKVRDLFLFLLYTGQRYSDLQNYKSSDVKNNTWYLRQTKTKKIIEIPLIQPAIDILNKYNMELPIITNQKMNQYLKDMGEKAELNDLITTTKYYGSKKEEKQLMKYELITTHTARRTFVSLASYDGVNQQVVKSFTGHGTDKMVNQYFKKNNSESKSIIENIFVN